MELTYPSTYLGDILEFLRQRGFKLDRESDHGGFHATLYGSRVQVVDPLGQKYEVLMHPIFKKKEDAHG